MKHLIKLSFTIFLLLAMTSHVELKPTFATLDSPFGSSYNAILDHKLIRCACKPNCNCNLDNINNKNETKISCCKCKDIVHTSKPCKFNGPYGIFLPRPQGLNSAFIFDPFLYKCSGLLDPSCAFLNLGYRHTETTEGTNIAVSLFGTNKLDVQGSLVSGRSNKAIVADWFGLNPLYSGSITFEPIIKQDYFDFGTRFQLGCWKDCLEGFWIGVYGTLVHANWNLKPDIEGETINNESSIEFTDPTLGAPNYPMYMNLDGTTFSTSLKQVLSGNFTFGDMTTRWKYGKFDFNKHGRQSTKLANLDLLFGFDIMTCDDYHTTVFLKAVAPTGTKLNRKNAEFIFNPIIGNGHHWELGAGLDMHYNIWRCDTKCLGIYINGCITHLFKNKQWRTFDFKKYGPLSRYMLLKELMPVDSDLEFDYAGSLENAVNYTTRQISSSFKIQGEGTIRLLYKDCGWAFGAGYNIYGRSTEKLEPTKTVNKIDNKFFGMKGNTGVYYKFIEDKLNFGPALEEIIPLNSTQTQSPSLSITTVPENSNTEIDNPRIAPGGNETWDNLDEVIQSVPPVRIDPKDIDFKSYPKQIIHKFFGHIDYQWEDNCYSPYIGIYGEYDIANNKRCNYSTPNQWGFGIRGGISF